MKTLLRYVTTVDLLRRNPGDAVPGVSKPRAFAEPLHSYLRKGNPMKNLTLALCAGLMAFGVQAQTPKVVTDNYPPYTITGGNKVSGVFVEILDASLKKSGGTAQYDVVPWARATAMAESGEVTATVPWFKTAEREAIYIFSDPVISATNKIFIKKGGKVPANLDWKTYADFKPYKFGGVTGYWYEEGFKKAGVPLEMVTKDEQNVQKLAAGRIDAFITDELVGWALIKKMLPGKEGEFTTVDKPESVSPLHVIAGKKAAGSAKFIESVNDGLKKIRASGEYDKIAAKYK